ncbi:MAG: tetratricopeptide repeat protein [Candidatus Acidiferrales bacterium]
MKCRFELLTLLLCASSLSAQSKPAQLFSGMGNLHHPIATRSEEAQKYFDQGLTFCYAFNHEAAVKSFERAAELDPSAAMPLWGIAYALGPNINLDVDPEHEKAAYEAVQKAIALSAGAPENERAYIAALARRYSNDPKADLKKLGADYAAAMKQLSQRYADDLDAATLYAEALMDLNPWKFWSADGKPAEGTEEIVSVLESVLRRDPNHIGANHFYIHALEASPHPEYALASAHRLETLVPAAGHLVHMPAHIYIRTGDYMAAMRSNDRAARADEAFFRAAGSQGNLYATMYYSHNLHFLAVASGMAGNYAAAKKASNELVANVTPALDAMPMAEWFLPVSTFIELRFARWDKILSASAPPAKLQLMTAVWHYARGVAFAAKGDVKNAEAEGAALAGVRKAIPADTPYGFNGAQTIFELAAHVLDGRIEMARGNRAAAIEHFRKAVEIQDSLAYDEPPDWYYPVRETLGAALLLNGQPAEAERVFRADLERNPRNGRSLFGLEKSLEARRKTADAAWVRREFESAWQGADTTLRLEDF